MPRVTIHMPTYNQGRFVGEAIESALNQTYQDYEVILSNNHSTDETDQVIARYEGHPKLRVIRPPTFLDGAEHFRFCTAQSDSELFSYLCTDDVLRPRFLERLVGLLDRYPSAVFAHSAAEVIDEQGRLVGVHRAPRLRGLISQRRAQRDFVYGSKAVGDAMVFRRAAYDRVGGFGHIYVNDWDLNFKLCALGDIAYETDRLMAYRVWGGSERNTERQDLLVAGCLDFFEKHEPNFPELRRHFRKARLRRALTSVALLPERSGETRAALERVIRRMSDDPRVGLKIAAFDAGLGPLITRVETLPQRLKARVKKLLFGRSVVPGSGAPGGQRP